MSAQVATVTELEPGRVVARQMVWVAPQGDEGAWLMVRAQRDAHGVVVEIPRTAHLCAVAALRGRAVLMTHDGAAWLEQTCACAIEREHGGTATMRLALEGPIRRVIEEIGGVPRT